ncbi:oxidoreductase [Streptococcus moroccensis]|uniref:NADPH2 dehydrogenase n=1 Tax=Streptococcus moroccensis TaxID=1451356 RepID=A0ABT9YSY8_9STRE|nr:NADH:flavin oxidoreductase/NADH oxidase [Streptococcus moroccensis]MDQ0222245.1 NADPH2 dehydrogenase [Streptococcus moroccensis]
MSMLLSPATVAGLDLKNRVVMAPMCMYEVHEEDGVATPFHFAHYGARAIANVALIIQEATAVSPEGRLSNQDLGIWNDQQLERLTDLVAQLHFLGSKVGIQLVHAGRKAKDVETPLAPSALAFNQDYGQPEALSLAGISEIKEAFVAAAARAQEAGYDMIELHGAHGYLINQFLSPLTNQRTDQYGGNLENRFRLLKEILEGVKTVFTGPIWVRLSIKDYAPGETTIEEWQEVARWLEELGVACIDVSTGGVINASPDIPVYQGYQVPFATDIKQAVSDAAVAAVGLLDNPGLCEHILQTGQADLIMQGRALIRNVNWLADAAEILHDKDYQPYNHSYVRGQVR